MLEIRDGAISLGECACCQEARFFLTRYVFEENKPVAAYIATFTNGHHEKGVHIALTTGSWEEGVSDLKRQTYLMDVWMDQDEHHMRFADWDGDVWDQIDFPGVKHGRDAALQSDDLDQLYRFKDAILKDDGLIRRFFDKGFVELRKSDTPEKS